MCSPASTVAPSLLLGLLLAPPGPLAAAPPRLLRLDEVPEPMGRAVREDPGLRDRKLLGLEVRRMDLDHDGRPPWPVAAASADRAGLRAVNRPFRLFAGAGGAVRLVASRRPAPGGPGGVRQRCQVLSWSGAGYRLLRRLGWGDRRRGPLQVSHLL